MVGLACHGFDSSEREVLPGFPPLAKNVSNQSNRIELMILNLPPT